MVNNSYYVPFIVRAAAGLLTTLCAVYCVALYHLSLLVVLDCIK